LFPVRFADADSIHSVLSGLGITQACEMHTLAPGMWIRFPGSADRADHSSRIYELSLIGSETGI
jgi:hypothetical protein